jgi:hypothetical protein
MSGVGRGCRSSPCRRAGKCRPVVEEIAARAGRAAT